MYARHSIAADHDFADFHVDVARPANLRRWVRPQVFFHFDGESPFTPLPGDQGFPILEWGLNWCISSNAHQYLIIHAAVLAQGDRALIVPAPPGSGKSTLCAGLVHRGWRLLSDELTLVDPQSGEIVPLVRPISLKNASIDVLRRFAPLAVFGRVVHETTKGSVCHVRPPPESVAAQYQLARPAWVVVPKYVRGAATSLEPLSRARGFMKLVENTFNYHVHGGAGFATLASVIDQCSCFDFEYGDLEDAARVFAELASHSA